MFSKIIPVICLFLLAGCALGGSADLPPATATPAATSAVTRLEDLPTLPPIQPVPPDGENGGSAPPVEADTAVAPTLPEAPPAPSATPAPTETPTPLPTPTLHPMMIDALRQTLQAGGYPGSPINIEYELDRGANYRRFYASYLSDGLRIYALLTVPDGEPPAGGWPAIVFNHGYIPPTVYRTTERYVAYVDGLARNGYIVFRIDYRGHDRSEGEARGAYGDPGYLADVLNAVAALKQLPEANPEKIGMWGHSMGGYLTLRAMVVSPDIKAGVIWAGVVASYPDMLSRWRRSTPNPAPTPTAPAFARRWRQDWVERFGTPEENPAFWAAVSSNSYVGEISGPVQLHHGTADSDVPYVFSELLAEEMRAAGQPVELYLYPDDNHNLSGYFNQVMARTVEFYDRYLK